MNQHAQLFLFTLIIHSLSHPTTSTKFLFDRAICTGLGDRLGTMLTLAALAKLENAWVVFQWCEDPAEVIPRLSTHIPGWQGYNYSLSGFIARMSPPSQIILVTSILPEHRRLPPVIWANNEIPAEEGSDSVYTIAWRSTRLSVSTHRVTAQNFREAYRAVSRPLAYKHARPHSTPYVVLHLRGPDKNTFSPYEGAFDDPNSFCTGKVVRRLFKDRVKMIVMSSNASWANELLAGNSMNLQVDPAASPFDDMSLLLGASAIVQHAWGGWSSYSTIPALVAGKPLITTFRGRPHRFRLFEHQGDLPVELFDCAHKQAFFEALHASLSQ